MRAELERQEDADAVNRNGPEPCFMEGHWYIRGVGDALFIVPDDRRGVADTYGPDDATLERVNGLYRGFDQTVDGWFDLVDCDMVAAQLGLEVIEHWQRRWDKSRGYYAV